MSIAVLNRPTTGVPTTRALTGVDREPIRTAVRGRIDDVVLAADSRADARTALTLIGGEFGRVVHCAADSLGSVDELTSQLRAGGVSTVVITGAADVASVIALTNHIHRYGARVGVDATEIIARQPFSTVSHGIDYVICGAEALPPGRDGAVLIGRADWLTDIDLRTDDVKGPLA
ncbi:hypothetical protein GOEFS_076_00210 [Gordonia effusa NBRC 100432]|uniref:Uncharacterized protein n=1 Tax=Gordonia effusa NBRC 100432 TaxID=1077974 RepID=H0R291_9ACTN|nr:hypothetical protein [Gordonia effusa]GAB19192.1 hypothetical protein GOEFS_076_00210 [Gordonia effusa NBRC 100432]